MKGKKEKDEEGKPSEREMFEISGPVHLTCVDWRSADDRRSVAASLVQGVYVLERDRQEKRHGSPKAQAPSWWESFNYQCIQLLIDKTDSSIFGAVYEFKTYCSTPQHPPYHHQCCCYYYAHLAALAPAPAPPRFVIAFRGTITKRDTRTRDIQLDIQLFLNGLTRNSRYQTALQTVHHMLSLGSYQANASIWLAGHSLGSAIALQIGKDMAKMGCYLEAYLFNPPFTSAPFEMLKSQPLKDGIRVASSVFTAGLSAAAKHLGRSKLTESQYRGGGGGSHESQSSNATGFNAMLRSWVPYLFVNPHDPISAEYIGYFEHREKMESMGLGGIERMATQNSLVGIVSAAMGRDGEPTHLLPSAFLTKNMVPGNEELKLAHGIHQWWKLHPHWQSKYYQLKST